MKLQKIKTLPRFVSSTTFQVDDPLGIGEEPEFTGSQACCPYLREDGTLEVYFSARDQYSRSFPFKYVLDHNLDVVSTEGPLAPLGATGEFDDSGFMISQVIGDYWYYTGWNDLNNRNCRYRTACGLLDLNKQKQLILDRDNNSKCGTSMPFYEASWRSIFFMSYDSWTNGEPHYGLSCLELSSPKSVKLLPDLDEYCLARPVLFEGNLYFSKRDQFDYRKNPEKAYKLYVCNLDSAKTEPIEMEKDPLMDAYLYPIRYQNRVLAFWNAGGFRAPISVGELI